MSFADLQPWLAIIRGLPWKDIRDAVELFLYFMALVAVFWGLFKLREIRHIIREFREARGPLWDLKNTINDLREIEPVIKSLSSQVALLDEKVDAAGKQVAALQVESVSTRLDAADTEAEPIAPTSAAADDSEDHNWELLREYWRRNTQRLEYVIDNIADGRKKVGYNRLPRTNYTRIINKLQGQGLISKGAAEASRDLNDRFNSFRPRNRKVPDEVAGAVMTLDQQLEQYLVPWEKTQVEEAESEATSPAIIIAQRIPSGSDAHQAP